jgi:hypothetical protein
MIEFIIIILTLISLNEIVVTMKDGDYMSSGLYILVCVIAIKLLSGIDR